MPAWIVALDWSTLNRGSGDCPALNRPVGAPLASFSVSIFGSLICTTVLPPLPSSTVMLPFTKSKPVM